MGTRKTNKSKRSNSKISQDSLQTIQQPPYDRLTSISTRGSSGNPILRHSVLSSLSLSPVQIPQQKDSSITVDEHRKSKTKVYKSDSQATTSTRETINSDNSTHATPAGDASSETDCLRHPTDITPEITPHQSDSQSAQKFWWPGSNKQWLPKEAQKRHFNS